MDEIKKIKITFTSIMKHKEYWSDYFWWKNQLLPIFGWIFFKRIRRNKGIFIMEEDWDNLIILDGCRLDTFEDVIGKKIDYRISRGAATREFLEENFKNQRYNDTVIITANPIVDIWVKQSFYKVISVWKNSWDDNLNTILPEAIFQSTLHAENDFPNKRLIIWFMQPHFPFIDNPELSPKGIKAGVEKARGIGDGYTITPWREAEKGKMDIADIWKAYRRNLEIVLSYALKLADKLDGKTVISSDHGNTFRRLPFPFPIRIAGHPPNIHISELIKVPWMVLDKIDRKNIITGENEKDRIGRTLGKLKIAGKI